ncbi:MAG: DnaA ATPase domain-containing protein [Planctomycetota bacterium]
MATPEVEDIFADIVERAKALDPENTRKWFEELTVRHLDGGSLAVGCPDNATVQFLRDNCRSSFTRAAQHVTGHLVTVDFSADAYKKLSVRSTRSEAGPDKPVVGEVPGAGTLKLHPDYTFESFVVGPSNRLAHASCIAVSQSLGNTYNPLFVYGSSGLGKTHLLHAVCFEIQRNSANAAIQLLSCEDFVNKFIRAIEEGNLAGFQKQFRTADAIVIDDIQFLREREHSQEEFFHTFNALYNNGKQIILSPQRRQPAGQDPIARRTSDQQVQLGACGEDRSAELRDEGRNCAEKGPPSRA